MVSSFIQLGFKIQNSFAFPPAKNIRSVTLKVLYVLREVLQLSQGRRHNRKVSKTLGCVPRKTFRSPCRMCASEFCLEMSLR